MSLLLCNILIVHEENIRATLFKVVNYTGVLLLLQYIMDLIKKINVLIEYQVIIYYDHVVLLLKRKLSTMFRVVKDSPFCFNLPCT